MQSKVLVNNQYIQLNKDMVQLPNGAVIDDYYYIRTNESAMIVATDKDLNIVLKREYRHTIQENTIELPAGTFDEFEKDALEVAKRELYEETGYSSDEWIKLGKTIESPSKSDTQCTLFWAKNAKKLSNQHLDATEEIDLIVVPIREAVDMCLKNIIRVNNSVHGILRVARLLGI